MTSVAIVTPYCGEPKRLLGRCLMSVCAQTMAADHFMVADGHPDGWIDEHYGVRHIRLDRAHGDAGNVARAIGALLAIAEGYEAIGLLDADNWLEADHVATCLAAAARESVDYVVAKRTLRRPDESIMPLAETWPYDTNCMFFLRGAFAMLPQWAMIPQRLALVGDRAFYSMLERRGLASVQTDHATVNYHNLWAASYRALGEPLPSGAKENVQI